MNFVESHAVDSNINELPNLFEILPVNGLEFTGIGRLIKTSFMDILM